MDAVSFFRDIIRPFEKSDPQDASDALKCVPRIRCWTCLDTERLIHDRWVVIWLGYSPYELKKCKKCQGSDDHVKCVDSNRLEERGRPIPYHGQGSNPYSVRDLVHSLAEIYRREYKAADELEEKEYAGQTDQEVLGRSSWTHLQKSVIDRHIREWELEVDVKSIVDNVSAAVQAYSGNVIPLADLVANLKVKFGMSSEKASVDERMMCVDITGEGQPFLLKLVYHMTDDKDGLDVGVLNYFRTSRHVRGEMMMMKPEDGAAKEICRRMMSREAGKMFYE